MSDLEILLNDALKKSLYDYYFNYPYLHERGRFNDKIIIDSLCLNYNYIKSCHDKHRYDSYIHFRNFILDRIETADVGYVIYHIQQTSIVYNNTVKKMINSETNTMSTSINIELKKNLLNRYTTVVTNNEFGDLLSYTPQSDLTINDNYISHGLIEVYSLAYNWELFYRFRYSPIKHINFIRRVLDSSNRISGIYFIVMKAHQRVEKYLLME